MIRYVFRGGVGLIVVLCVLGIVALQAWGAPLPANHYAPSSTTSSSAAPSSTTSSSAAPSSTTSSSAAPSSTTTNPCHTSAGTCLTIVPNCPPGSPGPDCNPVPPCVLNDATQTPCGAATTAAPAPSAPDGPRSSFVAPVPTAPWSEVGDAVAITPAPVAASTGPTLPTTGDDRDTRTRILQAVVMFVIVGAGLIALTRKRNPS